MRNDLGGVGSEYFLSWAETFVKHVQDLAANGRKVLLTYDGYRAHMTLGELQLFKENNIIAYAIPAHTSGKLQPCDVVLFGEFKKAFNVVLQEMQRTEQASSMGRFEMCALMKHACVVFQVGHLARRWQPGDECATASRYRRSRHHHERANDG